MASGVMGQFADELRVGGPFFHLILLELLVALGVFAERFSRLHLRYSLSLSQFLKALELELETGRLENGLQVCQRCPDALAARMAGLAITGALRDRTAAAGGLREAQLICQQLLRRRIHVVRGLAALVILTGALGFLLGLVGGGGESYDLESRQVLLFRGMSEALVCVKLSLIAALVCLVGETFLRLRVQRLAAELAYFSAWLKGRLALPEDAQLPGRRPRAFSSACTNEAVLVPGAVPLVFFCFCLATVLTMNEAFPLENSLGRGMNPPASTSQAHPTDATGLYLARNRVWLEGTLVLDRGEFGAEPGWVALTELETLELTRGLRARASRLREAEARGAPHFRGNLNVLADRHLPYGVLYQVLEQASQSGFSHPKLVMLGP